jgi:hypothetical protein
MKIPGESQDSWGDIRTEEKTVNETQVLQETVETKPSFDVMSTWQHRCKFTIDNVKSVAL